MDELDDMPQPVTEEMEGFYREMLRSEFGLAQSRKREHQSLKTFAEGARWGVTRLFTMMGHGEWAENVLVEELESSHVPQARKVARRFRRVMMPGSRYTSSIPGEGH